MADKKLNEVPVVNDIVTILGKRSNGEIVQIDKSNLASIVGELLPFSSYNKGGLISGVVNKGFNGGKYIRIRHKSKEDIYSVCIINIYALSNGVSANFKMIISGHSFIENYIYQFGKNRINFNAYKKVVDGYTEIIVKLGGNGGAKIEIICDRDVILTDLGEEFDISTYTIIAPIVL